MKAFEELPVWREGRALVCDIFRLTRSIRDHGFGDPIQRAAVSVCSNIAEGHERGSTRDLIHFLFIAKGSAGEVRSQLYHAEDLGYCASSEGAKLREDCLVISRQLSAWIRSMQTGVFKGGPRYHKEPDRSFKRIFDNFGFERQADGTFKKVREPQAAYGKRKTENRKTEK